MYQKDRKQQKENCSKLCQSMNPLQFWQKKSNKMMYTYCNLVSFCKILVFAIIDKQGFVSSRYANFRPWTQKLENVPYKVYFEKCVYHQQIPTPTVV